MIERGATGGTALAAARGRSMSPAQLMRSAGGGWRIALLSPAVVGLVALSFAEFTFKRALVAAIFSATLAVLAAIDIERRVIPNRIVLPATAVLLVLQLALFPGSALDWTLVPLVTAFALMIPGLLGLSWIGMGDVKLVLLIGVGLGWGVIGAVLIAFPCSLPVTLYLLLRKGLEARKAAIPFGPFLALGALLVLFVPVLLGLTTT